jgi:hypothetical protein
MPKVIAAFGRLKLTSPAEPSIHLLALLIALLHAAMSVTAINTKSPTFDEPQHLTAGYSYWEQTISGSIPKAETYRRAGRRFRCYGAIRISCR